MSGGATPKARRTDDAPASAALAAQPDRVTEKAGTARVPGRHGGQGLSPSRSVVDLDTKLQHQAHSEIDLSHVCLGEVIDPITHHEPCVDRADLVREHQGLPAADYQPWAENRILSTRGRGHDDDRRPALRNIAENDAEPLTPLLMSTFRITEIDAIHRAPDHRLLARRRAAAWRRASFLAFVTSRRSCDGVSLADAATTAAR